MTDGKCNRKDMTEEERKRFESITTLMQSAYDSFNDRRSYEWKLSLSIWTALALLLVGLVQTAKFPVSFPFSVIISAIMGAILIYLHIFFSHGVARANSIDKDVFLHYNKEMNKIVNLPFPKKLQDDIDNLPHNKGWWQWSHRSQIFITILLVMAAVVLIGVRS